MRAESSQIPGNQGRTVSQSNGSSKGQDVIWAMLRRLKARTDSIELALSTARRDINRIDRKQYREETKAPPSEISEVDTLSEALFGGV